jgi:hypothetical protein
MNTTAITPDFAKANSHGYTGMSPERAEAIRAHVAAEGFNVIGEDWSTFTLTLHIGSSQTLWGHKVWEAEARLMAKWGDVPYCFSTDFTSYRLTFSAQN